MSKIGFIGTGWVGSAYAKNFRERGYEIVQYSLDPEFVGNKDKIAECDIVIIAVPTPTIGKDSDYSILKDVIKLVGKGKIAVIKSTILPGTTDEIQKENPEILILHSPEFLSVATADEDAAHPARNIIGIPYVEMDSEKERQYVEAVTQVADVFPIAEYDVVCSAKEAELIKYAHNCFAVITIAWHNLLYDVCNNIGADWNTIKDAIKHDKDNVISYLNPVNKGGRGAGGGCFIKDFAAFSNFFQYKFGNDSSGLEFLWEIEKYNINLLKESKKDLDIVKSVYPYLAKYIND